MVKKLKGKNGTTIELITEKIKKSIEPKKHSKRKIKKSHSTGKLSLKDRNNIVLGLATIQRIEHEWLNLEDSNLQEGKKDVSYLRKELFQYKFIIEKIIGRIKNQERIEYDLAKNMEELEEYVQIAQASRDGIILKKAKRQEKIDDKIEEVTYDTPMTQQEVIKTLIDYQELSDRIQFQKMNNYIGLGLGLAGIIGSFSTSKKENDKAEKIVTLSTIAISGIKVIKSMMKDEKLDERNTLRLKRDMMRRDLLQNEQISSMAQKDVAENINNLNREKRNIDTRIENSSFLFDMGVNLLAAMASGMYLNQQIKQNDNGKIDGKSLAAAIVSLNSIKKSCTNFVNSVEGIKDNKELMVEYQEISKKAQEILKQMEEKVYPLKGVEEPFDSIQIKDFHGKFYPKKDYKKDKIEYYTTINIPEFSMKRGDIVLLSGESGSGKSTFLRLLKRGDIDNRDCIEIDNDKKVDNLGNQYITFRPSINLGDESNILEEITGKQSISELNQMEKENLIQILQELKLDFPNLLEQLASKKIMEFSTGQQKRLALSKLFYRINDGASVIIVDEPVGNVEDKLIREQLELITKYAKNKNTMLLLTTHRLDLAEDLATKRYNINKNGVLEQIPVRQNEEREH